MNEKLEAEKDLLWKHRKGLLREAVKSEPFGIICVFSMIAVALSGLALTIQSFATGNPLAAIGILALTILIEGSAALLWGIACSGEWTPNNLSGRKP